MISFPMFRKNMGDIFRIAVLFLALLIMYTVVIIYMFDPKLADMLNDYQQALPEVMAAVGMTGSTGTLIEFINTYLYGFIMTLIPAIYTIVLTNKLLVRYMDNGSMACFLSTPTSRKRIIRTQGLSLVLGILFLMIMTALVGYGTSEYLFPGKIALEKYVNLNVGAILLQFAIAGITFFAGCVFQSSKGYYMVGAGLPIVFYVIQMMANMGGKLEKLKYATIFTLFPGNDIVSGNDTMNEFLILAGIGVVLFWLGGCIFKRKDLLL